MTLLATQDDLVPLAVARDLLPGPGPRQKVALPTLYRWCNHGLRGVRLESIRVGGRIYTSRQALDDFCTALAAGRRARRASRSRRRPDPIDPDPAEPAWDDQSRAAALELAAEGVPIEGESSWPM